MNEITKITNKSTSDEVRLYFEKVLELKNSGKEFPVNLEWGACKIHRLRTQKNVQRLLAL